MTIMACNNGLQADIMTAQESIDGKDTKIPGHSPSIPQYFRCKVCMTYILWILCHIAQRVIYIGYIKIMDI